MSAVAADVQAEPSPRYHVRGLRLWAAKIAPHGPQHLCLMCQDVRDYLKHAPIVEPWPTKTTVERRTVVTTT